MAGNTWDEHLSQISTCWTIFVQAQQGGAEGSQQAREAFLRRYRPVVRRYLLGAVRDEDAADELTQEFAVRFLSGAFRRASPERGRLRDFLKTSLYHLAVDHQRRQGREKRHAPWPEQDLAAPASPPDGGAADEFVAVWRDELVLRALAALRDWEAATGQPLYTVLRFRMDHPGVTSQEMAERIAATVGKPVNDGWVRKRLHEARGKFGELLIAEVRQSLEEPTLEAIEEELLELGLLGYCKTILAKLRDRLGG